MIFTKRDSMPSAVPIVPRTPQPTIQPPALLPPEARSTNDAATSVEDALASFGATIATGKRKITISWKAMEQIPSLAPGWDKYALETAYSEWAADKDAAFNEDARFLAWVKSFTKSKAAS